MDDKPSGFIVLFVCLLLCCGGSVLLLIDFTAPTFRWDGTHYVQASYRPGALTLVGFAPLFLSGIVCVLLYLRNQPDSSVLVIRFLQHLTREIVESNPPVSGAPAKSEDEIRMTVAQRRGKLDTQFQTVLRMAKELDTIEGFGPRLKCQSLRSETALGLS
jgi:hypothetical protein